MKTPRAAELSHRRAAGMAHATAGRARTFEMHRPEPDSGEIAEGLEDWQNRKGRTEVVDEEQHEHEEPYADWDF